MKKLFFGFICSLFLWTACTPPPTPTAMPLNTLKMQKNGLAWVPDSFCGAFRDTTWERIIIGFTRDLDSISAAMGFDQKEQIVLQLRPILGKQSMHSSNFNYGFYNMNWCVNTCVVYKTIDSGSVDNWIEIVEQENNFSRIKVRFHATMFDSWPPSTCPTGPMDSVLHITEGEAYLEVTQQ